MPLIEPMPSLLVEPIVRAALIEDLGRAGDITTQAVVPAAQAPDATIEEGSTRVYGWTRTGPIRALP